MSADLRIAVGEADMARAKEFFSGMEKLTPPLNVSFVPIDRIDEAQWIVATRDSTSDLLDPEAYFEEVLNRVPGIRLLLLDRVKIAIPPHLEDRTLHPSKNQKNVLYVLALRSDPTVLTGPAPVGLVGRFDEIAKIQNLIRNESKRLVVISGIGGQGKSTLARAAATSLGGASYWIDVSDSPDLPTLVSRLQRTLGLSVDAEPHTLIRDCIGRSDLLVIDNFESLISGQALPDQLLRFFTRVVLSTRLKLVITTRHVPVRLVEDSGDFGAVFQLGGLDEASALRVFADASGILVEGEVAAAVLNWSDGNPLALKLLAGSIEPSEALTTVSMRQRLSATAHDVASLVRGHLEELSPSERLVAATLAWHGGRLDISSLERLDRHGTGTSAIVSRLRSRNLIDYVAEDAGLLLHSLVSEAVLESVAESLADEVSGESRIEYQVLDELLLLDPYVTGRAREAQIALGRDLVRRIEARGLRGPRRWRTRLEELAESARRPGKRPTHLASNILALSRFSDVPLDDMNLSDLVFESGDFRGVSLADSNLEDCEFNFCEFSDDFGPVTAVLVIGQRSDRRWIVGTFEGWLRAWDDLGTLRSSVFVDVGWISAIVHDAAGSLFVGTVSGGLFLVEDLRTVTRLAQFDSQIRGMALGTRGQLWVACSSGSLFELDPLTGNLEETWRAPHRLKFVCVRKDDGLLAVGGDSPVVMVGHPRGQFTPLSDSNAGGTWTRCGAFSADGSLLVGNDDGELARWRNQEGEWKLLARASHGSRVWSIAVGESVISGGNDGAIRLWNRDSLTPEGMLHGHTSWVRALSVSPEGTQLLSGGEDQQAVAWNLVKQSVRMVKAGYSRRVFAVDFVSDSSRTVVCAVSDHRVLELKLSEEGRRTENWRGHEDQVFVVCAGRDLVASGSDDGEVRLWTEDGQSFAVMAGLHSGWVGSLAFNEDSSILASGGDDRRIVLIDTVLGQRISEHRAHSRRVSGLKFDASLLFSCSEDGTVRSSFTPTLEPCAIWNIDDGPLYALAVTQQGAFTAGGAGRIWRIPRDGEDPSVLTEVQCPVWSLDSSPDGNQLAVGADDGRVLVVDLLSGSPTVVGRHRGQVWGVRWDPTGRLLVSSGQDSTVRVVDWSVSSESPEASEFGVPSLYDNMQLRGSKGVSPAERGVLTRLGAFWK